MNDQKKKLNHLLPIFKHRQEIIQAYLTNSTLIVMGETGSGKSTQLPQILLPHLSPRKRMLVTQPRRVAAISLATRVAAELRTPLGGPEVGYAVRFDDKSTFKTRLKYVTDGLLLKELIQTPRLDNYECVVLDEVHERTLRTDILLGMLRELQRKERPDLKIIVMSATMDPLKFKEFFAPARCQVLRIAGRTYPVRIFYCASPQADYLDAAIVSIFQLNQERPPGDLLVFLTGQEEPNGK